MCITPGEGLEPSRAYAQGISNIEAFRMDYERDRDEWIEWCKKESPSSVGKYKSKLDKFLIGKKINTPEELSNLIRQIPGLESGHPDRHAYLAIRNYIRFLEKTGKIRRSEAEDFRAVIPNIRTSFRSESEKAITADDIIKAFNSITGKIKVYRDYVESEAVEDIRKTVFRLLIFTGLRETEIFSLIRSFNRKTLSKTIKAFNLERYADKLAVYDLETVNIPTRKKQTKRGYIAIFPKELIPEIERIKKYNRKLDYDLFRTKEMFDGYAISLSLLRKFHYNFFNDNAFKVPDVPADVYRVIEFMQGRTHKDVGGRNYRANVQTAVRIYYHLVDELKRTIQIL